MSGSVITVNRFYAPDHSATAQLLADLAEDLARHGQTVTVITSRLRYDDPQASLPPCETLNGVTIRRVWTTRFGRAGLWGRGLDYASFYLAAFLALLVEAGRGDCILAKTDPPLISIPAAIAARLKRARLVNWCQDLFPETASALGLRWAAGPLGRLLRSLRNWSLRQSAMNIALCDEMRSHLIAESVPAERIRIIHNWPDPSIRPLPRERQPGEPFTICYSGNLGRAHAVDAVIDLIERTRGISGLIYRFVGGGAGFSVLRNHVREYRIANVAFVGYAPRSQLSRSLARADAHLVTLDRACEGLIMPSKIYGILASGRPALFLGSRDGSVAGMLREADAGLTLDCDRPETWRATIESLIARAGRLAAMGRNARLAYERRYTEAHGLAAWTELLCPTPIPASQLAAPAPMSASGRAKAKAAARQSTTTLLLPVIRFRLIADKEAKNMSAEPT